MPLLTEDDLYEMIPSLEGKVSRKVLERIFRILSIDKLNSAYDRSAVYTGPDFAADFLSQQHIDYKIGYADRLKSLPEGPFITVSNHPYGHIDGMILIDLFGHLHHDYKVMVNKILALIKALGPNFIKVVPTGATLTAPKAESISGVKETLLTLRNGGAVGIFPSGAVSDFSLKDMCVRDRSWQDAAIKLIRKAGVPIVPVRFPDRNSAFYYSLGLIHYVVRLLRLPSEVLNKSGKTVRVCIGETISPQTQSQYESLEDFGRFLRDSVYNMPLPDAYISRSDLDL